ncbi:M23 family metallopeptidase [Alkalihalobacillus sp. LMS39]|uniref:LysM peptidoglycan-binding domain-containing M23 family metallopeptidase n=1 Tax=Alkalihalobacillus sp. LMS39 TaxID=2924032 RepID=UPI001FB1C5BD|nr:M23 family metallopeptidase [Alkalihalobacillus sp. LMS39]UOE94118.1 M23 family metallopeptidase [Alkalihalobacillus sp. LMS39]
MNVKQLNTAFLHTTNSLLHKCKTTWDKVKKQPRYVKHVLAVGTCSALLVAAPTAYANEQESSPLDTIYHVYIDGDYIGVVSEEKSVTQLIQEKIEELEEKYNNLELVIGEKVEIIPERTFDGDVSSGTDVLTKLAEKLTVKAEATAIQLDGESVLYVSEEEAAESVKTSLLLEYVSEDELEQFLNSEKEERESKPDVDENIIRDIRFTEEFTTAEEIVDPDQVLSEKEAVKQLQLGTLEEHTYTVKAGDVLGSIASEHSLKVSDLLDLNPDITTDTMLHIDQELNVTAFEPLISVIVEEASTTEEEIPYQTETKEDSSMFKGDTKVEQEGEVGTKIVSYEVTKENGKTVKREVISEVVVNEPTTKIVVKGTKEQPSRGSGTLGWPAVGGYISSYQGMRWGRMHKGIDIARPSNYNILAADSGTVTFAGSRGGFGNLVIIDHNNGIVTYYAHLASFDTSVGDTVSKGEKIGVMGQTGTATGIHLHFEVYKDGQLQNPMDYLK